SIRVDRLRVEWQRGHLQPLQNTPYGRMRIFQFAEVHAVLHRACAAAIGAIMPIIFLAGKLLYIWYKVVLPRLNIAVYIFAQSSAKLNVLRSNLLGFEHP